MNTYTVSIVTFGTHPSGKTVNEFFGFSEEQARKKANELRNEQKLLLLDHQDYSISISLEPNILCPVS